MRARLIKTGEKIIKLALADANLSLNYLSDRVRSRSPQTKRNRGPAML